ncbi:MAG: dihydroneopterin triphosphate diphosphatase [Candidatus Accumulibacter sp.]|jgi:dATP pyrophosphohydrolase|nr:dihydroneopterin triphosphate diphosphatase [Accumulibacter sp.]
MTRYKRPVSVLVVIHTPELRFLLIERASFRAYWQSVTGSVEEGESPIETARREVEEETGILAPQTDFRDWRITNTFEIHTAWRHRYAPGVVYNAEHVYSLQIERERRVRLAPLEHTDYCWLSWEEAAEKCFSWSNRDAIRLVAQKAVKF